MKQQRVSIVLSLVMVSCLPVTGGVLIPSAGKYFFAPVENGPEPRLTSVVTTIIMPDRQKADKHVEPAPGFVQPRKKPARKKASSSHKCGEDHDLLPQFPERRGKNAIW
jgi:hypothetical protein